MLVLLGQLNDQVGQLRVSTGTDATRTPSNVGCNVTSTSLTVRSTSTPPMSRKHVRSGSRLTTSWSVLITRLGVSTSCEANAPVLVCFALNLADFFSKRAQLYAALLDPHCQVCVSATPAIPTTHRSRSAWRPCWADAWAFTIDHVHNSSSAKRRRRAKRLRGPFATYSWRLP